MELLKKFDVSIIAHRGFNKEYPENTLVAFEKAIEAGADYIELDVHFSKDREIVVIHDGNTRRTGDKSFEVEETALEKLKTVDMGQGEKIPTLEEVVDLCKGKIGVQIEIKGNGLAKSVVDLVEKKDMVDQVLL